MPLTEADILNLGKQIGRKIESTPNDDLTPAKLAEIHLGAVITKDALLNPEIDKLERFMPEGVDE